MAQPAGDLRRGCCRGRAGAAAGHSRAPPCSPLAGTPHAGSIKQPAAQPFCCTARLGAISFYCPLEIINSTARSLGRQTEARGETDKTTFSSLEPNSLSTNTLRVALHRCLPPSSDLITPVIPKNHSERSRWGRAPTQATCRTCWWHRGTGLLPARCHCTVLPLGTLTSR